MAKKQLVKSRDKIVAGVLGGVAEYLGWDKTIVRLGKFLSCRYADPF